VDPELVAAFNSMVSGLGGEESRVPLVFDLTGDSDAPPVGKEGDPDPVFDSVRAELVIDEEEEEDETTEVEEEEQWVAARRFKQAVLFVGGLVEGRRDCSKKWGEMAPNGFNVPNL